jgi:hypothetical protein
MHLDFRAANAAERWKMDGTDEFSERGSSQAVGRNPLRLRWRAGQVKLTRGTFGGGDMAASWCTACGKG